MPVWVLIALFLLILGLFGSSLPYFFLYWVCLGPHCPISSYIGSVWVLIALFLLILADKHITLTQHSCQPSRIQRDSPIFRQCEDNAETILYCIENNRTTIGYCIENNRTTIGYCIENNRMSKCPAFWF